MAVAVAKPSLSHSFGGHGLSWSAAPLTYSVQAPTVSQYIISQPAPIHYAPPVHVTTAYVKTIPAVNSGWSNGWSNGGWSNQGWSNAGWW